MKVIVDDYKSKLSQYTTGGWRSVKLINTKSGATWVSRRLVFIIGIANRRLFWVRESDSRNRLLGSIVQAVTGVTNYNFSDAEQPEYK
jgi:hypothetical protein